jgi:hypothetical protein
MRDPRRARILEKKTSLFYTSAVFIYISTSFLSCLGAMFIAV